MIPMLSNFSFSSFVMSNTVRTSRSFPIFINAVMRSGVMASFSNSSLQAANSIRTMFLISGKFSLNDPTVFFCVERNSMSSLRNLSVNGFELAFEMSANFTSHLQYDVVLDVVIELRAVFGQLFADVPGH